MSEQETPKLLKAQRDEARKEAETFYMAGQYMAAALRFYAKDDDPYYRDAQAAIARWERVTYEGNFG